MVSLKVILVGESFEMVCLVVVSLVGGGGGSLDGVPREVDPRGGIC